MRTRLLMLTLTVGAFVVMWSGDHQNSRQDQAKLERIRKFKGILPGPKLPINHGVKVTLFWEDDEAESDRNSVSNSTETGFTIVCLPEADWMSSKREEHDEDVDSIRHHQIFASSLKTEDWDLTSTLLWNHHSEMTVDTRDKAIPLPVDLAPGEYRIFNDAGGEYLKRWTAEELASLGIPDSVPELNSYMLKEEGRNWYYFRENQPVIISTKFESETEQTAGIPVSSENCDADIPVSFDPTEPLAAGILFLKENFEMSVCSMEWFFSSIHLNVKEAIRETADSLAGMTATAFRQTQNLLERTESISTETQSVETPELNMRNANRFRCRQFH